MYFVLGINCFRVFATYEKNSREKRSDIEYGTQNISEHGCSVRKELELVPHERTSNEEKGEERRIHERERRCLEHDRLLHRHVALGLEPLQRDREHDDGQ